MASWYAIRARASGAQDSRAEVAIYDEIGAHGVSAKGFLAELGALPDAAPIDVRLNSPGGSVFDAVAIHNALKRHEGTVTVWIDGIAASAASYVAMAGDEIVMPENAFLMIHDPAGLVMGTAADMRAMAEALEKVKGSLVQGYAARSGRDPQEIAALMAAETWFDAKDALDAGLATRIAEPVRIAARFDIARFRNAPPELMEAPCAEPAGVESVPEGNGSEDGAADIAANDGDNDGDAVEPDPASLAGDKTFDPAQAGVPGFKVCDGNLEHSDEQAPPSPVGARDGADPNIPSRRSGPAAMAPVDTDSIRAEAIAHARAVVDLCRLAGQPLMAGRFLEQDASLDAVRAALLDATAEAEPDIAPHHPQPGRNTAARPWGEIVARTFRLKG